MVHSNERDKAKSDVIEDLKNLEEPDNINKRRNICLDKDQVNPEESER